MLLKRLKDIMIFLILTLFLVSGEAYSQVTTRDTVYYDTTNYIPGSIRGALDYNLMIAAERGYTREIDRLVQEGADIFSETDKGVTPLIFAIANNHTEITKILLAYGSDPNKMTLLQETPLIIAVKNQNSEIAEALIQQKLPNGKKIDTQTSLDINLVII